MKNKCKDCGNCCLDTEMILSRKDIDIIITNYHANLRENDFIFLNNANLYQLKNYKEHCIFFEPSRKECMIYDYRPRGCAFYPLIFDLDIKKCKLDDDCPRKSLFYENKDMFKKTCREIKRYLKEELSIKTIE
ncbi:MAG: YkgJ family cysteine cluster protein [Promethearchaeota archaeon]